MIKPLAKTDTQEYSQLLVKRTFIRTSGDRNEEISCEVLFIAKNTAHIVKNTFTATVQGGRIEKLECGQSSHVCESKCALKKFESTAF